MNQEIVDFIAEWNNETPTVTVQTSGSTGSPKKMKIEKEKMRNSARITCSFLGLKTGDSALLCVSTKYIAGKMMIVRAFEANLRLICIEPSSHPLHDIHEIPTFAAMIPMQVFNSLQVTEERNKLMQIKHLIIGGGSIDEHLAKTLQSFPNAIWSTYGMTETLSHIALRRLSGALASEWYTPFEHVNLKLSNENTLIINAPLICDMELTTNDIVEINNEGKFRIIGRKDNTINSGGIKIQIEEIEKNLKPYLSTSFMITSKPDEKFGEIVVILTEATDTKAIQQICHQHLPKYWQPKQIITVKQIPLTETNKPNRAKAKQIAINK